MASSSLSAVRTRSLAYGMYVGDLVCEVTCSRLERPVRTLSFSHDSLYIASGSEDALIDIAEVATAESEAIAMHDMKHRTEVAETEELIEQLRQEQLSYEARLTEVYNSHREQVEALTAQISANDEELQQGQESMQQWRTQWEEELTEKNSIDAELLTLWSEFEKSSATCDREIKGAEGHAPEGAWGQGEHEAESGSRRGEAASRTVRQLIRRCNLIREEGLQALENALSANSTDCNICSCSRRRCKGAACCIRMFFT